MKIYLDSIYQLYAIDHPEKGLYIDMNTSNDTLEGHIGPVRAAEAENVHSVQMEFAGASVTKQESVEESSYAEEPPMEENQDSEQNQNFVAEPLTYGTYSLDDGTGTTGTAEIGFYTDGDCSDYIRIECWRNESEIVYFQGILEKNGENYCAYCEEISSGIFVTFADGGFYVEVTASDFPDIEYMEGFYVLTEALNLNGVA